MLCLLHQIFLICFSVSILLWAAPSEGRNIWALSTSTPKSLVENVFVSSNHQRPALVFQGCPSGYRSCSSVGDSEVCCPSGQSCVLDAAGNVACCPFGAVCTGIVGGTSSIATTPTRPVRPTTANTTTTATQTITTVTYCPSASNIPGGSCTTGFYSCPLSLGGGCCHTNYACATSGCVLTSLPNCAYGPPCGYYRPQCCAVNEFCSVDFENIAQCTSTNTASWQFYTTTYVETDLQTITSTATTTTTATAIETITSTFSSFGYYSTLTTISTGSTTTIPYQPPIGTADVMNE